MKELEYGKIIEMPLDFESAIEKTSAALKDEGFGILTEIDVKDTLKKKLDIDFKKYRILGACNPPLAHQALKAEEEIGLLLPCNVVVSEVNDNLTKVLILNPVKALSISGNDDIRPIAEEVLSRMENVLNNLENIK